MNGFRSILSVVLSLAVAGGSQVCMALCAAAQSATTPVKVKAACARCAAKKAEAGKRKAPVSCKFCEGKSKEQIAPERDGLDKAPVALAAFHWVDSISILPTNSGVVWHDSLDTGPPAVPLAYQICVLLI